MPAHPLDPLSLGEIAAAKAILAAAQNLGPAHRFAMVRLEEPSKSQIKAGAAVPRRAFLLILDRVSGDTFEAIVDLDGKAVSSWTRLPFRDAPYGQAPVMIEEFFRCEAVVKSDTGWRNAMHRRGLTDADIERVQVDPFSSGFFDNDFERGHRVVRAVSYYRADLKDNGYAHPIEGVVAVVDLVADKVVDLVDETEIIPIPRKKRNYDLASQGALRTDVKPLDIVQPQGPSFTVDGWKVAWQNWHFRVGFTPREGLVLYELAYDDRGKIRPIIYRASVTEMVVPYSDPTANHYWKTAFDAGEYGLGKLANALELGCDCLGNIHYFDIPFADDDGEPFLMKNAVCMHEEDYGILWKHYEFRNDTFEVRRSRRLVISFFATVGNYDYGFYWYLYQDGTIALETKLSGIIQTAAVAPGKPYPWGGMVDEGLGGPTHQHFFNARLHLDLDGGGNTVTEHEFRPRPWGADNPYGNVFDTTSTTLTRELEATRVGDGATGRFWKFSNPNATNTVGGPTGYKMTFPPSPLMLAQEGSSVRKRGGFATKHIWVTKYDEAEKYASGDYPNLNAGGGGLPAYIQANRNIENEDIVVWHSFGHTHVCKPEDFPVMPVEYAGFVLKPSGFFGGNVAMDLPAGRNEHSVDHRNAAAKDCCAEKTLPLLESILEGWRDRIGGDFAGYRNHVYRVLHFSFALRDCTDEEKHKLIIAGAFHDLGIWSDKTVDYLPPSVALAVDYLAANGLSAWDEEIALIIDQHHKLRPYRDARFPLIEVFRKADLADFSLGLVRGDVPGATVSAVKATFPNAGFHKRLTQLAGGWFAKHPISPPPFLKW